MTAAARELQIFSFQNLNFLKKRPFLDIHMASALKNQYSRVRLTEVL
jgi:hypothetical protein